MSKELLTHNPLLIDGKIKCSDVKIGHLRTLGCPPEYFFTNVYSAVGILRSYEFIRCT